MHQYAYFSMAATQARPPNHSYPSRRDFFAFSYFLDGCAYPVHPPRADDSLEKHSIFKSDLQIITNTKQSQRFHTTGHLYFLSNNRTNPDPSDSSHSFGDWKLRIKIVMSNNIFDYRQVHPYFLSHNRFKSLTFLFRSVEDPQSKKAARVALEGIKFVINSCSEWFAKCRLKQLARNLLS